MQTPIDRHALVMRHNPHVTTFDPYSALSVGNGEFAFTVDATGLQTFPELYAKQFPLGTTAQWAWHTSPLPPELKTEDFRYENWDTYGRTVPYPTSSKGQEPLYNWLRANPHRFHLGRVALELTRADGTPAKPDDIQNSVQNLDLWSGEIDSRFTFDGVPVRVQTLCHPRLDLLAVRVESPLLRAGKLKLKLAFPYGSAAQSMADWNTAGRHQTAVRERGPHRADLARTMDNVNYLAQCAWNSGALKQAAPHTFTLQSEDDALEFVCLFTKDGTEVLPDFAATREASRAHWQTFWQSGGAVDLSAAADPRAKELERRIVLSQFLTAIHCAGSLPPQETGLLFNSWNGKFHLEMHWWHAAHFTYWNRLPMLEKSLHYYRDILPQAKKWAAQQGYKGARWPKMTDPDGRDSPSPVGPLLIWQQPHPIYYAALCYRAHPTRETLEQWREVVFETADFMATYAVLQDGHYVLGPPLKTVSENTDAKTAINPPFELSYWRFGLRTAQTWREKLGLPREPKWDEVLTKLALLPQRDGVYLQQENLPDTYEKWNYEHPALLGALGVLPGDGVDVETMRRTAKKVFETWQWGKKSWGWDYPMAALCAARCGEPELAVNYLMIETERNRFLPNGHNYQLPGLPAYLPGNGALLFAIAGMCAGWDGGPKTHAPGFPANWNVRYENLSPVM